MSKEIKYPKRGFSLNIFGGILIGISAILEVNFLLSTYGFSIFEEIKKQVSQIPGLQIFLSLCLFLGLTAATLSFLAAYFLWKNHIKTGIFCGLIGGIFALCNLATPPLYGFETYEAFSVGTILGFCLIAIGAELASPTPKVKEIKGPILTSAETAIVAVLSALYAVMIIIANVPSPTGGMTHIGDVIVFIAALLFGYKVGGLVGIVGAVAADLFVGYPRWFVSVLAHGLEGLIPGFAKNKPLPIQVLLCIVGGFLMATTYFLVNIFIKGYPLAIISYMRDLFGQAGISIIVALIVVGIIKRALPRLR